MRYEELAWNQIPDLITKVVVVPLGSLEQHGRHLPMFTDSMIGKEIVRRAEIELSEEALFLPILWVGSSHHHIAFPGTISVRREVYVQLLTDVVESLISAGFRRILLLSAHGGNNNPANAALYDVQMRHRHDQPDLWLVYAYWVDLAAGHFGAIPGFHQGYLSHACEAETSMILQLRPELVQMNIAEGARVTFGSDLYFPDESSESRVTALRPMEQLSKTGALGYPELGTAEKGEHLFQLAAKQVGGLIRELASWRSLPATE
jgi:creatinine amidohydrolase